MVQYPRKTKSEALASSWWRKEQAQENPGRAAVNQDPFCDTEDHANAQICIASSISRESSTPTARSFPHSAPEELRGKKLPISEQMPGTIVRRIDKRPTILGPNDKIGDKGIILGSDGRPWSCKIRPMIVVDLDEELGLVTEVPIYTYNDTGLENTPKRDVWQYFSLKPLNIAEEDFVNQNPDQPILRIGKDGDGWKLTRGKMVVKFTQILSRSAYCDDISKMAELDETSTEVLVQAAFSRRAERKREMMRAREQGRYV